MRSSISNYGVDPTKEFVTLNENYELDKNEYSHIGEITFAVTAAILIWVFFIDLLMWIMKQ